MNLPASLPQRSPLPCPQGDRGLRVKFSSAAAAQVAAEAMARTLAFTRIDCHGRYVFALYFGDVAAESLLSDLRSLSGWPEAGELREGVPYCPRCWRRGRPSPLAQEERSGKWMCPRCSRLADFGTSIEMLRRTLLGEEV